MKKAPIPAAIVAALAIASGAHADPSASATVTCETFTVDASGLQAGDRLIVEQGSTAPGQVPVDEASGTAHATLKATTDPWFTADVVLVRGDQLTVLFHRLVDCDGNAPDVDPTVTTPTVAVAEPVVPATLVVRERRVAERLLVFGLR